MILARTLQLSQISLMAIWLAIGKTSVPWRLTAVAAGLGLWSCALPTLPPAGQLTGQAILLAQRAIQLTLQTIAVTVPLLATRPLGLTRVDVSAAGNAEESLSGRQRFQFSILSLIGWATALAVILSTIKSVAPDDPFPLEFALNVSFLVFLIGRAAVALAAAWAILGTQWSALRIGVLPVAVLVAFLMQPLLRSCSTDVAWHLAMLCLLEALLLAGPLCVVRVAGYRLAIKSRTADA